MKNASECAKQLSDLMKGVEGLPDPEGPELHDPIAVLVFSFLLWESTTPKAATAYRKLTDQVVDLNELRVCLPHEMVEAVGTRYPMATERTHRLRAVLRDLFLREHDVHLRRLHDRGKREIKKYLETLDGMPPYVASRVMLLCFDTHAIPVDEQLRQRLIAEGAADESADVAELTSWLSRQIKAEDGVRAHAKLQGWVDQGGKSKRGGRKTARRSVARRTSKKKTSSRKTSRRKAASK